MYLVWAFLKIRKYEHYYFQMSYKDMKYIKTDFEAIASICNNKSLNDKLMKRYSKLYPLNKVLSDIQYYCKKYKIENITQELETEIISYWK